MLTGCISLFPWETKLSTQALVCTYLLMAFLTFLSRVEKEIRADVETLLCCFHLIESCAGFFCWVCHSTADVCKENSSRVQLCSIISLFFLLFNYSTNKTTYCNYFMALQLYIMLSLSSLQFFFIFQIGSTSSPFITFLRCNKKTLSSPWLCGLAMGSHFGYCRAKQQVSREDIFVSHCCTVHYK